jgi:hypothetical protein
MKLQARSVWVRAGLLMVAAAWLVPAQSFVTDVNLEHDPGKRSELALTYAKDFFESARDAYGKGDIHTGDRELEQMTKALNLCMDSLEAANKSKFYKKAELRVANLQRRLADLIENLNVGERGWAEQTGRKVEAIHEKLLSGAMRK